MKQEEKSRRSREEIIDAAIEEFGSLSYAKISLNTLCKKYHISKGKFYHHFESKDALFIACLNYAIDKALEYDFALSYKDEALSEQFHNLFLRRREFVTENPPAASFLLYAFKSPPEHLRGQVNNCRARFKDKISIMLAKTFAPYPWVKKKQIPFFTEIFLLASEWVHEKGFEDWKETTSPEESQKFMDEKIAMFDELIHVFLYGILAHDEKDELR